MEGKLKTQIIPLMLLILGSTSSPAQSLNFVEGDIFPFSEIETMSGASYSIDSLEANLLVMNFWNIGCKPCIQELPFLNDIYDHFGSRSIAFWSVTLNKKENITKHLMKHPIKWDFKGDVDYMGIFGGNQLNIKAIPTNSP